MQLTRANDHAPGDIRSLFTQTFSDAEGSEEGEIIGHLVQSLMDEGDGDDIFGFLASNEKGLMGGIFFSRLSFESPADVFLLSPVAVLTPYQGQQVGQRLIEYGKEAMRQQGANALLTYGDPNYYSRVGFGPVSEAEVAAPYSLSQPIGWLFQSLDGTGTDALTGTPRCVKAFQKPEIW